MTHPPLSRWLLATLLLTGPYLPVPAVAAQTAPVTVTQGWFRAMPAELPSGGYFALRNDGSKSLTLSGITTPVCGMVMMHRSIDGRMDSVATLAVPAGETVRFAPGGYHLMCMGAKAGLRPGGKAPVTLHFTDGSTTTVPFDIRNAAGK